MLERRRHRVQRECLVRWLGSHHNGLRAASRHTKLNSQRGDQRTSPSPSPSPSRAWRVHVKCVHVCPTTRLEMRLRSKLSLPSALGKEIP